MNDDSLNERYLAQDAAVHFFGQGVGFGEGLGRRQGDVNGGGEVAVNFVNLDVVRAARAGDAVGNQSNAADEFFKMRLA